MSILYTIIGWIMKVCCQISFNNYILALFFFALIMQIILFPLGIKQQKSSVLMGKIRPKEMAIRNKYKGRNDQATQQKMNAEIQELYKQEGYSAFAGCLPLLIQLPIIFALFGVVRQPLTYTTNLNHADDSGIQLVDFYDRAEDILNAQIGVLESVDSEKYKDEIELRKNTIKTMKQTSGNGELALTKVIYYGEEEFAKLQKADPALQIKSFDEVFKVEKPFTVAELKDADYATKMYYSVGFNAVSDESNFDDLLQAKGMKSVKDLPNFELIGGYTALDTPTYSFNWLLLVPLLIFVTSYLSGIASRKFMGQSANNQATGGAFMTWGMPLISAFFGFSFPAAIGIYWIYRSITGIGQQYILAKMYPVPTYTKEELDKAVGEVKKAKKRKKVITIEVDEDDSTYDSLAISEERAEKLRKRREKENERAEAEAIARHAEKEAAAEKSGLIEKSPLKDDVKKDSEDKE